MNKNSNFTSQLLIVGGFLALIYMFFALATSVYRDYKLDVNIQKFEASIDELEKLASQKPKDISYYQSLQYKDKYAKENLNLINPGERMIIIPKEDTVIKSQAVADRKNTDILKLPNSDQWLAYFFGNTLSLNTSKNQTPTDTVTGKTVKEDG